jgi:hypothetical protein
MVIAGCGRLSFDSLVDGAGGDSAGPMITYVDGNATNAGALHNVATVGLPTTVPLGDLVIAQLDYDDTTTSTLLASVVDTVGNTYTVHGPTAVSTNRQYVAYTIASATGVPDVIATLSGNAGQYFELRVEHYTNVATAAPLDMVASMTGTTSGTDAATVSITVSAPHELVYAVAICLVKCTPGSGDTQRMSFAADVTEDRTFATAGTFDMTATITAASGNWWAMDALAFRPR